MGQGPYRGSCQGLQGLLGGPWGLQRHEIGPLQTGRCRRSGTNLKAWQGLLREEGPQDSRNLPFRIPVHGLSEGQLFLSFFLPSSSNTSIQYHQRPSWPAGPYGIDAVRLHASRSLLLMRLSLSSQPPFTSQLVFAKAKKSIAPYTNVCCVSSPINVRHADVD